MRDYYQGCVGEEKSAYNLLDFCKQCKNDEAYGNPNCYNLKVNIQYEYRCEKKVAVANVLIDCQQCHLNVSGASEKWLNVDAVYTFFDCKYQSFVYDENLHTLEISGTDNGGNKGLGPYNVILWEYKN